ATDSHSTSVSRAIVSISPPTSIAICLYQHAQAEEYVGQTDRQFSNVATLDVWRPTSQVVGVALSRPAARRRFRTMLPAPPNWKAWGHPENRASALVLRPPDGG